MNLTHTAKTMIHADLEATWEAITQAQFVKDFLPEVKKDITQMGAYVQATHRNAKAVMPAYMVAGQTIGWDAGCGTRIELPRQDTQANIETVNIHLTEKGDYTEVAIEVNYQPDFNIKLLETRRCVKGLFGMKLNVLKKDLEANQTQTTYIPAFA